MGKILDYNKYIIKQELQNEALYGDVLSAIEINQYKVNFYNRLYVNNQLMLDVADDFINEDISNIIFYLENDQWEKRKFLLPQIFYNSMIKSKRLNNLTPYTIEELKNFKLFKLRNFDIGFALNNDEIVAVHNNSGIGGIGDILIRKAIEKGGKRLDHFDGYLTGFYKKHNFSVVDNLIYDKQYEPKNWKYESVDIDNPNTSIYVEEIKVNEKEFNNAKIRYKNGMPDVVFRML